MCEYHFQRKSFLKYTRVAMNLDGGEVKSMIHLVIVKKDNLRYVQDVGAVRGMG